MLKINPLAMMAAAICLLAGTVAAQPVTIKGMTEPYLDVTLGLADAGIISKQFFKEGDTVQKGNVILELDKRLEALEVDRRKAVMEQDKKVYESTRTLLEHTKSVSQEEMSKAEAEYNVSAAEYGIAAQQLENRQLIAPFTGCITEVLLKPGAACAPYQSLVRLVDTSRCYFTGYIDGVAAPQLKLDQAVQIKMDSGRTVDGKICFISPTVDAASGLVKVKAIFENSSQAVRPGLAAEMVTKNN